MESVIAFVCEHAHYAPWIILILLLLTGIGLPISEDILIIGAGVIATTCIPDHHLLLFLSAYIGAVLSAWESYWIGRCLGPQLFKIHYFSHFVHEKRLEQLRYYYNKFGIFAFIVGRFCPGGIRNGLFLSSGLTKMAFPLFIFRDSIAAFISTLTFYFIGYLFGTHLDLIKHYLKRYSEVFIALSIGLLVIYVIYYWYFHKKQSS